MPDQETPWSASRVNSGNGLTRGVEARLVAERSVTHYDIRPDQQTVDLGLGKQPVFLLVAEKPL
jgi:hypothetical protein